MLLAKINWNFMHGFKSAILTISQFLQNGTFEPMYEIWNSAKNIFLRLYENIHDMSQGPPNPGFMQKKVQKEDFLKKALAKTEFLVLF